MELVSFGDHLKQYIYERADLEEPYSKGDCRISAGLHWIFP